MIREPAIRPITVILIASVRLPLEKPVQEIVIPEVGSREAKSIPKAKRGLSAKKILPMAKPIRGVIRKFIIKAVPWSLRFPFFRNSLIFKVTIIG